MNYDAFADPQLAASSTANLFQEKRNVIRRKL